MGLSQGSLRSCPPLIPPASGRGTTSGKHEKSGLSDNPSRPREGRETWRLRRLVAAGWVRVEARGKRHSDSAPLAIAPPQLRADDG